MPGAERGGRILEGTVSVPVSSSVRAVVSSTLTRQPSSRQSAHGEGLGYEACPASTRTLCWLPVAPAQHLQLVLVLQNARHEAVGTPFCQPLRMTAWAAAPDPIHLFCRIRGPSRAGRPVIQPPGILVHRHRRDRLPDLSLSAPQAVLEQPLHRLLQCSGKVPAGAQSATAVTAVTAVASASVYATRGGCVRCACAC